MSGICGIIDLTRQGRADGELVGRMAALLRHRGPDSDGFYSVPDVALGVQRLSTIDLKGGNQPLFNEDQTITLIFDGVIYNYRELRDTLRRRNHILNTESDGETIIHLYEEFGLGLFSHLRGMYAFALWDSGSGQLVLAVDHVGMKPLYLHERDGKLFFASEAKALFADPAMPRRLNPNNLDTYLRFGYMMGTETLFEGIKHLPPGHAYVFETGKNPFLHAFWEFPKPSPDGRARQEGLIINEARDLLADTVSIHLRSDVPAGILLGGGIESAALLAFAAQQSGKSIKTFSLTYDSQTESSDAHRLAEYFHSDHYEHQISAEDWWSGLEKFIYFNDEPVANTSAISLLLLAEATSQSVKTALSPTQAALVFGGSPAHYAIPQMLTQQRGNYLSSAPLQNILGADETTQNTARIQSNNVSLKNAIQRLNPIRNTVFNDDLRAKLYKPELPGRADYGRDVFASMIERIWRDDPYDTAQALVINGWLAGNGCLNVDKASMSASLELRAPFLDAILMKFAANVPPALRLRDHQYVLREAARPYLPDFALERPRQSTQTPVLRWFDSELESRIREVLLNPNGFITQYFNRAALENLLKDHFWGRTKQYEIVFRLLVLELWGQTMIKPVTFSGQPPIRDSDAT
jgi:asparagine synthase (glutamine-hydrolysing)